MHVRFLYIGIWLILIYLTLSHIFATLKVPIINAGQTVYYVVLSFTFLENKAGGLYSY